MLINEEELNRKLAKKEEKFFEKLRLKDFYTCQSMIQLNQVPIKNSNIHCLDELLTLLPEKKTEIEQAKFELKSIISPMDGDKLQKANNRANEVIEDLMQTYSEKDKPSGIFSTIVRFFESILEKISSYKSSDSKFKEIQTEHINNTISIEKDIELSGVLQRTIKSEKDNPEPYKPKIVGKKVITPQLDTPKDDHEIKIANKVDPKNTIKPK